MFKFTFFWGTNYSNSLFKINKHAFSKVAHFAINGRPCPQHPPASWHCKSSWNRIVIWKQAASSAHSSSKKKTSTPISHLAQIICESTVVDAVADKRNCESICTSPPLWSFCASWISPLTPLWYLSSSDHPNFYFVVSKSITGFHQCGFAWT